LYFTPKNTICAKQKGRLIENICRLAAVARERESSRGTMSLSFCPIPNEKFAKTKKETRHALSLRNWRISGEIWVNNDLWEDKTRGKIPLGLSLALGCRNSEQTAKQTTINDSAIFVGVKSSFSQILSNFPKSNSQAEFEGIFVLGFLLTYLNL